MQLQQIVGEENLYLTYGVRDESKDPETKKTNQTIISLATSQKLPLLCTSNFHYLKPADQEAAEVALCIKDGKRMFDSERRKISDALHILSEDEVRDVCKNN